MEIKEISSLIVSLNSPDVSDDKTVKKATALCSPKKPQLTHRKEECVILLSSSENHPISL